MNATIHMDAAPREVVIRNMAVGNTTSIAVTDVTFGE